MICWCARPDYHPIDGHDCGCIFGKLAEEDAPYVCPGCYAVGGERCAPGCIDAEIEDEHRRTIEGGDYDRSQDDGEAEQ